MNLHELIDELSKLTTWPERGPGMLVMCDDKLMG
jgi:hypothetical protein